MAPTLPLGILDFPTGSVSTVTDNVLIIGGHVFLTCLHLSRDHNLLTTSITIMVM